jgi:hypothetical protein
MLTDWADCFMTNWKDRVEDLIVSDFEEALDKLTEARNKLIELGFSPDIVDNFWSQIDVYPNEIRDAIIIYIDARNDYKIYE